MNPITNHSQDYLIFLVLPLMLITLTSAWKERHTLWDLDVTSRDRDLLMRITMFVLMPVVVFLHECGHAAATLYFGGKVAEFHYGLLWGYVVPSGFFTHEQMLMIYLAGNIVEVLCGVLAFLCSLIVTTPPVVALLLYLSVWSISGTVIVYALMSLMGMYGDWIAIYSTPVRSWIPYIAAIHAIIVIALLYGLYGSAPRLWFTCRTRPNWANRRSLLLDKLEAHPSADLYLDLGWLYFEAGLDKLALEASNKAIELSPNFADPLYLQAWLEVNRSKIPLAQEMLTRLSDNPNASPILQSRALMAIGQLEEDQIRKRTKNGPVPEAMWKLPLEAFAAASLKTPELGDPRFYKARVLNKAGRHILALDELSDLHDYKWLDPKLSELVQKEIDLARKLSGPPQ